MHQTMTDPQTPTTDSLPTRRSLLSHLRKGGDDAGWTTFYDTYWRLIFNVARKRGISEPDAQKADHGFETAWDEEWRATWLATALQRVKSQVHTPPTASAQRLGLRQPAAAWCPQPAAARREPAGWHSQSGSRLPHSIGFALALLAAAAHAGPRTSASYAIATDIADIAGRRTTSANYTNTASAGGITGLSASTDFTAKHGYIAQLTDATGLTLTAVSLNVNETNTLQLAAWQTLDDATFLAVPAASVAWSATGPFTIAASGLGTAGIVYQNTSATAQGIYLGQTGTLGLTVVNTLPDNFGTYAGDGLEDGWQVGYFGLDNSLAAPAADPDGDGQTNLFEFTAGLIPIDPASRFILTIAPVVGVPSQKRLLFSPLVAGRIYSVESRSSLTTGAWAKLIGTTQSDTGSERTVTDLGATGEMKFYRVNVSTP